MIGWNASTVLSGLIFFGMLFGALEWLRRLP